MKSLIISFIFTAFTIEANASIKDANEHFEKNDLLKSVVSLMKDGYNFAAAEVMSLHLDQAKKIDKNTEHLIEKLILKTGIQSFTYLRIKKLKSLNSESLKFVLAYKYFKSQNYKAIPSLLTSFKNKRFEPEALYLTGTSYELTNQTQKAVDSYNACVNVAQKHVSRSKKEKLKRYFQVILETCITHLSRVDYKNNNFEKGIDTLNKIEKISYLWPYTLKEKAWHHYNLKDYNRALGLLVTYKAPLLNSYFSPEIEYMNALSYFRLCQYDDTLKIIDRYYEYFKPKSEELKKFILPQKKSNKYFLKLALTPTKKSAQMSPFLRQVITQLKKKVKFSLDLTNYRRIVNEYSTLKKFKKKNSLVNFLKKRLRIEANYRGIYLNHFVKKELFSFLNQMHRYSFELFNIKIDVLAAKRNLLYASSSTNPNEKRGNISNLNKKNDEFIWIFNGEFWADELGDYSFALENKCSGEDNV